ncbi:S-layer homology domain-containing protein [Paenibacillus illinoisensis]|uniref:S-layer homology domain-containing protein n=1 Tax=Paenibacillus illinoisensis TaxID=59845 RepID=UPI00204220D4|nr:S-layer homology domain-containing protein [Paenibacillus illinoisensis]MCM3207915.1 S-layer homology domain-containing protein [Paenibacillus illinoisensis]
MRNTSDPIKENSHVMNAQGGEKKVMKKILSVALSTAMAFSMFASVAFGDTAVTPQQQFDALKAKGIFNGYPDGTAGLDKEMTRAEFAKVITKLLGLKEITGVYSYNDKNYNAKNWAAPYIEAVTAAGIMEGKNVEKKIFDFNGKVTIAEMATILTRALDLEIPTETNNSAAAWAKGYVQAAINAGLIDANANFSANASRELLVGAAYSIDQAQSLKVTSYTVSEAGKVVEFKISDGETVKVTLDKALEANKETEVKFTYKDKEFTEKVTYVVTEATKLQSVSADNLKEVTLTFDGKVDKSTAELKDNYKLNANLAVKSAVLSASGNEVVLTLDQDQAFKNQQKYTVTVSGVKAGAKTIQANNVEFTPVDNKLPEVVSVTGLGTKAVKIVFSEPVKQSYTNNFQVDGQGFYSSPNVEGREVILKSSSALSVGEHTLTVTGVEDFAGFKSLKSDHKFTVVEDTTPPTIAEATATLEKLTVTFSEDIDDSTLDVANVYHKRGDSKISPERVVRLAANKYEFYFDTDKALPSYETTIFVEKVKDFSGNEIKETSKLVKAEIDTERPQVLDARVTAGNKQQLALTFSKSLAEQDFLKLITVKDKDGKVRQISNVSFKDSSTKNILLVNFFSDLPEGTNTLTIAGVKDNTVLGNVMLDYTTTFNVGDTTAPKVGSVSFNVTDNTRRAVIVFDEKMDPESLLNRANYVLTFEGKNVGLPSDAYLSITQDGKAVVIELPVTINNVDVTADNLTQIRVQGVKDVAGNYLAGFQEDLKFSDYKFITLGEYNDAKDEASLTAKREIKVKLNQTVSRVVDGKTTVKVTSATGSTYGVTDVVANDTDEITIKLANDLYTTEGLNVEFAGTKFIGAAQNNITFDGTQNVTKIDDEVKPEVASNQNTYATTVSGATYTVTINVTENLKDDNAELVKLFAQDLTVTRLSDNKVVPVSTVAGTDFSYSVSATNNVITVTIIDAKGSQAGYSIEVKDNAKYIQDKAGNVIAAKGAVRTSN